MEKFASRLRSGRPLVGDGGWGTMLMQHGLAAGECPESLNLTRPEVLEKIASAYLDAGAEIITTNTFGGSFLKLVSYDLHEQMNEINRAGASALRKVAGDRAYVSGSCGPSGKILKPYGDADPEELHDSFAQQVRSLVEAQVDCICIETMVDLAEATLAIKAARSISPTIPIVATMTFEQSPRGFFTMMGNSIEQAAAGLKQAGADAIGSNCGNGIEQMVKIAAEFCTCGELPVIIQSNAGLPRTEAGGLVYDEKPDFMADKARELVDLGVRIIGGCCGTTPEHIQAIRQMVESSSDRSG